MLHEINSASEEHIHALEKRVLSLNASIMDESNAGVCNQLQTELRADECTLVVSRSTLEAKGRIAPVARRG